MDNSYNEIDYDEALLQNEKKFNELTRYFLTLPLIIPNFDYSDIHIIVSKIEQLKQESESLILSNFQNQ